MPIAMVATLLRCGCRLGARELSNMAWALAELNFKQSDFWDALAARLTTPMRTAPFNPAPASPSRSKPKDTEVGGEQEEDADEEKEEGDRGTSRISAAAVGPRRHVHRRTMRVTRLRIPAAHPRARFTAGGGPRSLALLPLDSMTPFELSKLAWAFAKVWCTLESGCALPSWNAPVHVHSAAACLLPCASTGARSVERVLLGLALLVTLHKVWPASAGSPCAGCALHQVMQWLKDGCALCTCRLSTWTRIFSRRCQIGCVLLRVLHVLLHAPHHHLPASCRHSRDQDRRQGGVCCTRARCLVRCGRL